jgi:hypothetical protein
VAALTIIAHFSDSGNLPVLGLTPLITVRNISGGSDEIIDDPMIEDALGFYQYEFVGYDEFKSYGFVIDGGAGLPDDLRYIYGSNAKNTVSSDPKPFANFGN